MKKRILSVLLCLVMVLGLLPTAAFAAETSDDEYPKAVDILERKQGTQNILTLNGLTNNGGPVQWFEAKKYAGTVDDSGKKITYDSVEDAEKAGCVAYLDAKGVYHFLRNVTDKSAYYPKSKEASYEDARYANRLELIRGSIVTHNFFTKTKIVVHKDVTVNLKYLRSEADTEIVLEEGSKLIIDNSSGKWSDIKDGQYGKKFIEAGLWAARSVYNYTGEECNLTVSGNGTLIVNYANVENDYYNGATALRVSGDLCIKDSVNVEVNKTRSIEGCIDGGCIYVHGDTRIDTTGYVKANLINLAATNVNAIKRDGSFLLQNASSFEISSAALSDYGNLIFDQDYEALGKNTWSFPDWNIETNGSEVSFGGILASRVKLKKSYAKFTRDGVSDAKLTPQGGEAISSLGKATITPGESSKTFTITATAEEWLKTLVTGGRAEYTLTALVFKNNKLLLRSDGAYTVAYEGDGADEDGNPYIQIQLKNAPKAGEVYSFSVFVKPVATDTENQLCDSAYGSWTLTTEAAPVAHNITIQNGYGTASPSTAKAGDTVTVTATDRTGDKLMFTQWYAYTSGVTFKDATQQTTTFTMPDYDVSVSPGFQGVGFTKQPAEKINLQTNYTGTAQFAFSWDITKWELVDTDTKATVSESEKTISAGTLTKAAIPANTTTGTKTYQIVVTTPNGETFKSEEFTVLWYDYVPAPLVDFTVVSGTKFVGKLEVGLQYPDPDGHVSPYRLKYTTNGVDPKDAAATDVVDASGSTSVELTGTATIKARTYERNEFTGEETWGELCVATYTKVDKLDDPTVNPESQSYASPAILQETLALYIQRGSYDLYLNELRHKYAAKRACMAQNLTASQYLKLPYSEHGGGVFFWVQLPPMIDPMELWNRLRSRNIKLLPSTVFSKTGRLKNYIRLSYVGLTEEQIAYGIRCIDNEVELMLMNQNRTY